MDDLDVGVHPRCSVCGVVMRDDSRGYVCPACGHSEDESTEYARIEMPPDFDGPVLPGA